MKTLWTLAFVFVFSASILAQPGNAQNDLRTKTHKAEVEQKDQKLLQQSQLRQTEIYKTANVVYRLDSMLEEEFNTNTMQWEADDLEHIFYSPSYVCTAELDFDFSASGRDSSALSWYTFDANGNFTQDLTAYYDYGQWDTAWKEVMTYDAANRYIGMVEYDYNNGQWENDYKSTYTYDANGHLLMEERFSWDNTTWETYYKKDYTNHSDGRIGSTVDYYYASSTPTKDDSAYYHYNTTNQLVERTRYDWSNNQWELDHRYLYAYDANSYLQSRISLYYYPSTGWDTSYRYLYNHNVQGYLLDQIEQDWSNGQWENYYKDVVTYDMNYVYPQIAANPYYLDDISVMYLSVKGYDWDDNAMAWTDDYRETLYWSHTGIGIAEAEAVDISFYPNPATETLHIALGKDSETTIKLYSLSGRLLLTQTLNSTQHTIDVSSYDPGLYVLWFEHKGHTAYKKVVVY